MRRLWNRFNAWRTAKYWPVDKPRLLDRIRFILCIHKFVPMKRDGQFKCYLCQGCGKTRHYWPATT